MVKAGRDQAGMSDSARPRQAGASARARTKHGFGGSFVSGIEWSRVQPRRDGWQAVKLVTCLFGDMAGRKFGDRRDLVTDGPGGFL
jgi:hypothetical protein